MPSDEEIAREWNHKSKTQAHPLDIFKEQIEQWDKEGHNFRRYSSIAKR